MKSLMLLVVFIVAGCSAHSNSSYSLMAMNDGVKVLPAVVTNPAPVCEKSLNFARLDKPAELQVYVDVKGDGRVCKSNRY